MLDSASGDTFSPAELSALVCPHVSTRVSGIKCKLHLSPREEKNVTSSHGNRRASIMLLTYPAGGCKTLSGPLEWTTLSVLVALLCHTQDQSSHAFIFKNRFWMQKDFIANEMFPSTSQLAGQNFRLKQNPHLRAGSNEFKSLFSVALIYFESAAEA